MSDNNGLRAALEDMLSGWKYIRSTHGDLYGVGWDRAQQKAERALAATPTPAPAAQGEAVCVGCEGKPSHENNPCGVCNHAAPERAEVRPPVHTDTERLDFIVSKVEGDEHGWWLPDWCIKDGEHKPSSDEVRSSIDTRRGITPHSAADSAQGGAANGEAA